MVSVCTVPARGGRSCEHFGGYKTINRIPLPLVVVVVVVVVVVYLLNVCFDMKDPIALEITKITF